MGIKKKLGLGVASAALGISLVGGGTWAAFNDVEVLSAEYAAGKLNLKADDTTSTGFNLSNLKPGDVFQKEFTLDNIGTLAIKDVLLKVTKGEFVDYLGEDLEEADTDIWGVNTADEFLSQFTITVASIGTEGGNGYSKDVVKDVNLLDFINMTNGGGVPANAGSIDSNYYDAASGRINVVTKSGPDGQYHGLPVNPDDQDKVLFTIKFDKHDEADEATGVQLQNKYQGDAIKLDFNFEARQWDGLTITKDHVDANGYILQNEKSHSENGGEVVDPGDGDDNNTPDPEPITLVGEPKLIKVERWSEGLFKKTHYVRATAEFEFSDGEKVTKSETKVASSSNSTEKITISVTYDGKPYSKEFQVKNPF